MITKLRHISLIIVLILTSVVVGSSSPNVNAQDGDSVLLNQFNVTFISRSYAASSDQTTFTYLVEGTGNPPDLSHFDIEIPHCEDPLVVVAYSPTDAVSFGVDPTTGVDGIKWDLPLLMTQTRTYSITFEGNVSVGTVVVAVKGDGFETGTLPGGSCTTAAVDVEKSVSSDGTTWHDYDVPTGLDIPLDGQVWFRFIVLNEGNVDLTDITLSDDTLDVSACTFPEILEPLASVECILGPFGVVAGQHINFVTVTAVGDGETVTDTDAANYWGGDRPSIDVEKQVTIDGGVTWDDADEATGPSPIIGDPVQFRFVVTNDGNLALTNLTLTDDSFDLSTCQIPDSLAPEASFECLLDPVAAVEGQHVNTATATAMAGDQTVTDTDAAHYFGVEDEDDVIIVIEGPVTAITINIITIFDIDIQVDPNDPILTQIQIGDRVRINGQTSFDGSIIVIVAINVTIINVNVIVVDGGGTIGLPANCKLTGFGNGRITCKGSGRRTTRRTTR